MRLCAATAKLVGLENDEVLVEGLQGGVGEASDAVKDRSAEEDHVEPLDERAAGQAVEDGLLVEAARVEVWVAEGCDEGGILQALVADDQFGLHGGVEVVLLDPAGDALGEGVVIEWVAEFSYGAVDLEDFVDGASVAGVLRAYEADVEGRYLRVFEPSAEEEVATSYAEGRGLVGRGESQLLHLAGELWSGPLVGVEDEDPGVFEADGCEGGIAMRGVVVEGASVDVGAGCFGDLYGVVCGVGVEDVNVVGPGDGGEAVGEVALLVASEDENGDHLSGMVSR
jgi:hypothetical protein